jgi:serine/threonine protein kinase
MKSLNQLQHPGVVTFYHHFRSLGICSEVVADQMLFLVMEYCGGGSLRYKLEQQRPTQNTVFQWIKELVQTLQFVHKQGIVHHDIKPENILFTSDGSLKIGDFGVANRNFGTLAYLAPEMFLAEVDSTDRRVDVYALGITLLELLMNHNPFDDMSRPDMQRAKVRHDFIPVEMERWVQDLISRATHPTPELRFQSMDERGD